jgi:hypothetical protein
MKRSLFLYLFIVSVTFLSVGPLGAATFTVTNNLDAGVGSLRWAINQANVSPGFDTIAFNIGGGGPVTIQPLSQLPPLDAIDNAGCLIDGFTQPGGAGAGSKPPSTATLLVEINGLLAGPAHGLWIWTDNNIVQGLAINEFEQDGIRVEGGLSAHSPSANANVLFCNFVGTDLTGTVDLGNGRMTAALWGGVHICNSLQGGFATDNVVDGSLISGNWADGAWIEGPKQPGDVGFNHITLCYIGTDSQGIGPLGNDHEGVALTEGTHDNQVLDNLISANIWDGVGMQGFNNFGFGPPIITHNNTLYRNIIGMDVNLQPLGNGMHGVAIGEYGPSQWGCAMNNVIKENAIACNGTDGVAVVEDWIDTFNADGNLITRNAIFFNNGHGIDLGNNGVTLNDAGDVDVGANEEVNFPVITGLTYAAGITTVSGSVSISTPPNMATVEVFLTQLDPSNYGEGEVIVGSTTPNAAGNWSITTTMLIPGDFVTATCTDMLNNTSEFCQNGVVPGTWTLYSGVRTISERIGGSVGFSLSAGAGYAGRGYAVLGSVTGVSPGTPLPGGLAVIPLNNDWFMQFVLQWLNTAFFVNFLGNLDALGNGGAQLNLPPLPAGTAGLVMHYAFCTYNPFDFTSNPVGVVVTWY